MAESSRNKYYTFFFLFLTYPSSRSLLRSASVRSYQPEHQTSSTPGRVHIAAENQHQHASESAWRVSGESALARERPSVAAVGRAHAGTRTHRAGERMRWASLARLRRANVAPASQDTERGGRTVKHPAGVVMGGERAVCSNERAQRRRAASAWPTKRARGLLEGAHNGGWPSAVAVGEHGGRRERVGSGGADECAQERHGRARWLSRVRAAAACEP